MCVGRMLDDTIFRAIFTYLGPYMSPHIVSQTFQTSLSIKCNYYSKKDHPKMSYRQFLMKYLKNSPEIFKRPYLGTIFGQIGFHWKCYSSHSFQATAGKFHMNVHQSSGKKKLLIFFQVFFYSRRSQKNFKSLKATLKIPKLSY